MEATLTSFNIMNRLEMGVRVDSNPLGLDLSNLFEMGARVNPKRSFLFVSKLIGKHLDVHPDMPRATGYLLANLIAKHIDGSYFSDMSKLTSFVESGVENGQKSIFAELYHLSEPTMFIGFAETATGLGHSVFSAFDNAFFVHTTREELQTVRSVFDFEEEHSHAVDHRCYLMDERWLIDAKQIVLIDDEMTTGKTTLNLIRSMHSIYPKRKYIVLSLLDWRTSVHERAYRELEKELGIEIVTLTLIRGGIEVTKEAFFSYSEITEKKCGLESYHLIEQEMKPKINQVHEQKGVIPYLQDTGRFGISSLNTELIEDRCEKIGKYVAGLRKGDKTLVMGIGEFMYLPSRIASYMGDGVTTKSTTRSPIFPSQEESYPIKERLTYVDDCGIQYFLYNMSGKYDEVVFVFEYEPSDRLKEDLTRLLTDKGIEHVNIVVL